MAKPVWDKEWQLINALYKTPYADWHEFTGGIHAAIRGDKGLFGDTSPSPRRRTTPPEGDAKLMLDTDAIVARALDDILTEGALPPLPADAVVEPETHDAHRLAFGNFPQVFADAEADPKTLPNALKIDRETRLIGVIDLGVPLGHRWTRKEDGTTRILAAWQQAADRSDLNQAQAATPASDGKEGRARQHYLPFGRELLAHEIDALLQRHTGSGNIKNGFLDEEAFNRATFTEDYRQLFGNRELGRHASHGAHVLHLAAAAEPGSEFARDTRLLVVNFPERSLVGHSAVFLEYFAILAFWRIIVMADKLWELNFGAFSNKPGKDEGFELVINLSFGKQASSRDGRDFIARMIRNINWARPLQGRRPVYLSIPAGNENLEQGNARIRLNAGAEETFDWRIQPDDQSANFLEIWAPWHKVEPGAPTPLEIEVISPDNQRSTLSAPEYDRASIFDWRKKDLRAETPGNDGGMGTPADVVARIYAQVVANRAPSDGDAPQDGAADEHPTHKRMRYVVAVKQTLLYEGATAVAPAGLWRVRIRNRSATPLSVSANVQTDQTVQPVTSVNKRSYLERPEYRRFDETGRRVDAYSYSLDPADPPRNLDNSNVLRRHGSINAIGMSNYTATMASHRATDGRPAAYSSTGISLRPGAGANTTEQVDNTQRRLGTVQPTASMPGSDGAAHFGTLSSGSRDGSVAALSGTSFCAAMAARLLTQLDSGAFLPEPAKRVKHLETLAEEAEQEDNLPGQAAPLKVGKGRLPNPVRPASQKPGEQLQRFNRRGIS